MEGDRKQTKTERKIPDYDKWCQRIKMKGYERGWLGYFSLGDQVSPLRVDAELKPYVQERVCALEIGGRSLRIRGTVNAKVLSWDGEREARPRDAITGGEGEAREAGDR